MLFLGTEIGWLFCLGQAVVLRAVGHRVTWWPLCIPSWALVHPLLKCACALLGCRLRFQFEFEVHGVFSSSPVLCKITHWLWFHFRGIPQFRHSTGLVVVNLSFQVDEKWNSSEVGLCTCQCVWVWGGRGAVALLRLIEDRPLRGMSVTHSSWVLSKGNKEVQKTGFLYTELNGQSGMWSDVLLWEQGVLWWVCM